MIVAAAAAAFAVSYGVVLLLLLEPRVRARLLDRPGERSLHVLPTPRGGGLGVVAGAAAGHAVLVTGGLLPGAGAAWIGAGALLLATVSFADDLRDVPPVLRLAVHGTAAGLLVVPGLGAADAMTVLGTLLAVVWMINLYNFMDGMDGLAAGMAVIGFGALTALGVRAGDAPYAASALVLAAAALAFLRFNFPPASIFLGDVGSCTLGYGAAWMILRGARDGVAPAWVGTLAFAPFVVDATLTLARRALAGERVWEGHRAHLYQRVVGAGLGLRRTLLVGYALMALSGLAAVVAVDAAPALRVGALAGLTVVLAAAVARAWRLPVW